MKAGSVGRRFGDVYPRNSDGRCYPADYETADKSDYLERVEIERSREEALRTDAVSARGVVEFQPQSVVPPRNGYDTVEKQHEVQDTAKSKLRP